MPISIGRGNSCERGVVENCVLCGSHHGWRCMVGSSTINLDLGHLKLAVAETYLGTDGDGIV